MRDLKLENPEEERNFRYGVAWVGDGEFLWPRESEAGALCVLFCWLAWVAEGCPYSVVTAVDAERGIVTIEPGG